MMMGIRSPKTYYLQVRSLVCLSEILLTIHLPPTTIVKYFYFKKLNASAIIKVVIIHGEKNKTIVKWIK